MGRSECEEDSWAVPDSLFDSFRLTPLQIEKVKHHAILVGKKYRDEIRAGGIPDLAVKTDLAIERMVMKGIETLKANGDADGAYFLKFQYEKEYRGLIARSYGRPIGDHALPDFLKWIDTFYQRIVSVIGVDAAKALHLSDLWVVAHCIPIVFRPATFPMDAVMIPRRDEYRNHFAKDAVYWALVPVLVWWDVEIICLVGTSGLASFLCGPAAMAGEYITGMFIAPKLSDFIYDKVVPN